MKIGILGYGNLGKGVEFAVSQNSDMELVAVFTRRNPNELKINSNAQVVSLDDIEQWQDKIDVLILCGGSATDLPIQTPKYAKMFNVVDSYDNHKQIPIHFENVDNAAKEGKHLALISTGWDPGLFSLNRLYSNAILPEGKDYTFWGKGISQGHSDAIRRIDGVKNAKQYTIPVEEALETVRKGENPTFTARQMHTRECFVVAEDGADKAKIEQEIKNVETQIQAARDICDYNLIEELALRKQILIEDYDALIAIYNDKSLSAKITDGICQVFGKNFKTDVNSVSFSPHEQTRSFKPSSVSVASLTTTHSPNA